MLAMPSGKAAMSTTGTVTVGKSLSTQASGNGSAVIEFIPKNL